MFSSLVYGQGAQVHASVISFFCCVFLGGQRGGFVVVFVYPGSIEIRGVRLAWFSNNLSVCLKPKNTTLASKVSRRKFLEFLGCSAWHTVMIWLLQVSYFPTHSSLKLMR